MSMAATESCPKLYFYENLSDVARNSAKHKSFFTTATATSSFYADSAGLYDYIILYHVITKQ